MANKHGNTGKVAKASVKLLIPYPELDIHHSGRVFTKHYTNLSYSLEWDQLMLFEWLCHESTGSNTFSYSMVMVKKYKSYIKTLRKKYKTEVLVDGINLAPYAIREVLVELVEMGMIFNTEVRGEMFINPNLSYRPKWFNGKIYKEYVKEYNAVALSNNITELLKANQKAINRIKEIQSIYKK